MKFIQLSEDYANAFSGENSIKTEMYLVEKVDDEKGIFLAFGQPNACSINVQGVDFLPIKKTIIEQFQLAHVRTNDIGLQINELYIPGGVSGSKKEFAELGGVALMYPKPSMGNHGGTIAYIPPEQAKQILKPELVNSNLRTKSTTSSTASLPDTDFEKVQQFEEINGVHIYKSIGNYDFVFRNFKFILTPENTVLPSDSMLIDALGLKRNADNYRDEIIDEQSINFKKYGQFEIFIPVEKFPLVQYKSGYIIARMAQTLVDNTYSTHSKNPERYDYVTEKQKLYNRIKEMVISKKGKVEVVLEFPNQNSQKIDRNVGFRCASGQYIDYVGQLKN